MHLWRVARLCMRSFKLRRAAAGRHSVSGSHFAAFLCCCAALVLDAPASMLECLSAGCETVHALTPHILTESASRSNNLDQSPATHSTTPQTMRSFSVDQTAPRPTLSSRNRSALRRLVVVIYTPYSRAGLRHTKKRPDRPTQL